MPEHFRFGFKVTDEITVRKFPNFTRLLLSRHSPHAALCGLIARLLNAATISDGARSSCLMPFPNPAHRLTSRDAIGISEAQLPYKDFAIR